jgi:hypothetical protein
MEEMRKVAVTSSSSRSRGSRRKGTKTRLGQPLHQQTEVAAVSTAVK